MGLDKIFSEISSMLINYDSGDMLLLSDLSDKLEELKLFFLENSEITSFIDTFKVCSLKEMKMGGMPHLIPCLSDAIDLLQSFSQTSDEQSQQELLKKIADFPCRNKKLNEMVGNDTEWGSEAFPLFLADAEDRLNTAQSIILKLEENPNDAEAIGTLFRIFHTIKGECGFLKIATLGELTHSIESLLSELRDGKTTLGQSHIDLLLEGIDLSNNILEELKSNKFVMYNDFPLENYLAKVKSLETHTRTNLGELLVAEGKLLEEDVQRILEKQKTSAYTKRFGEIAVQEEYLTKEELNETLVKQKTAKTEPSSPLVEQKDPIIKVRSSKVNFLVDMIGELLIAIGQINENISDGGEFLQVRKITRSLQYGAMELRTDSLQSLFGNLRRAVRDLSRQLKKNVRTLCVGDTLEIDRSLIEKLEEPLMHLVRNSLDHGVDSEEERTKTGKPAQATITLKGERRGNQIVITVRDDGRGLNRPAILAKAIERGLCTAEAGEVLNDSQVFNFIFAPGFSTHEKVSQISGRGVGMDIVRNMVSEHRGRIEIESQVHQFSEFRLVFPLSTAIIDGMITRVSDNLFVFPISSIIESIKIRPDMLHSVSKKVEVANVRGDSIPLIRMHQNFGIDEQAGLPPSIGLICESSDQRKFMFVLDEVLAKREVVLKSFGSRFSNLRGISSGTVLAGGRIGLVVDVDEMVELSVLEA